MQTSKRIEGDDFPNGGTYAVLHFQGVDGSPVEESDAVSILVFEYDRQDRPVAVTTIDVVGEPEPDDDSTGT